MDKIFKDLDQLKHRGTHRQHDRYVRNIRPTPNGSGCDLR